MNREQVKLAADALGRLEALERALADLDKLPHGAMPISFYSAGEDDDHQSDHGTRAFYPRVAYIGVLNYLIGREQGTLDMLGVSRD